MPRDDDAGLKQAFDDFLGRVNNYVKLRSSLEGTLPKLKTTNQAAKIDDHGKALSEKIIESRKDAKQGDIFSKDIATQFRKIIAENFRGQDGRPARQTIRQGEPVGLQIHVNQVYPARIPNTTVPPTLLLKLPRLPRGIEYRIIGHAFALLDVTSRIVIDYIPDALPSQIPAG